MLVNKPSTAFKPGHQQYGFKPGQSGNPGGRARVPHDVIEAARAHTLEAIKTLAAIMRDPEMNAGARVQAASILIDRGWGKAPQTVTLQHDRDPREFTDAELNAVAGTAIVAINGGGDPAAAPGDTGQPG